MYAAGLEGRGSKSCVHGTLSPAGASHLTISSSDFSSSHACSHLCSHSCPLRPSCQPSSPCHCRTWSPRIWPSLPPLSCRPRSLPCLSLSSPLVRAREQLSGLPLSDPAALGPPAILEDHAGQGRPERQERRPPSKAFPLAQADQQALAHLASPAHRQGPARPGTQACPERQANRLHLEALECPGDPCGRWLQACHLLPRRQEAPADLVFPLAPSNQGLPQARHFRPALVSR